MPNPQPLHPPSRLPMAVGLFIELHHHGAGKRLAVGAGGNIFLLTAAYKRTGIVLRPLRPSASGTLSVFQIRTVFTIHAAVSIRFRKSTSLFFLSTKMITIMFPLVKGLSVLFLYFKKTRENRNYLSIFASKESGTRKPASMVCRSSLPSTLLFQNRGINL